MNKEYLVFGLSWDGGVRMKRQKGRSTEGGKTLPICGGTESDVPEGPVG